MEHSRLTNRSCFLFLAPGKGGGDGGPLRSEEAESRQVAPWNETPEELEKRLQQAVARINKDFDVRGLCMEFPDRLHDLANKTYGDRLPK